jgi:methylase of polypeptide subunit release factors
MTCSPVSNGPGGPNGSDSAHGARWLSPDGVEPSRWEEAGDQTTAAAALVLARKGIGLLYQGDYQSARQLLAAMGRKLRKVAGRSAHGGTPRELSTVFRAERELVRQEHDVLSRLAIPIGDGYRVALRRAPDVHLACEEALGPPQAGPARLPLRDLLGMIGAHEWRRRGVEVAALGARVHPHFGVYAPIRGEYVELVSQACEAWPVAGKRAVDVGTGTGVLAFVLARRGASVVATDLSPRAVACARENADALGLSGAVEVRQADLFPGGQADLVVCNPPWIPSAAHTDLDRAIYDPGGRMLTALVVGLPGALRPGGEAWIILSDLAERLGLRAEGEVEALIGAAGLAVTGGIEAVPSHPKAKDEEDPLHAARSKEVTSLRRLVPAPS